MGTHWAKLTDSVGRYLNDGALPTSVSGAPSVGGPARKTRIATFYGNSFVSERGEVGALHVFHVGTTMLPTDTIGDRAPCGCNTRVGAGSSMDAGRVTAETIQRRSEEMRKSRVGDERRCREGARASACSPCGPR
jgi:hypothetical protein